MGIDWPYKRVVIVVGVWDFLHDFQISCCIMFNVGGRLCHLRYWRVEICVHLGIEL